MEQVWRDHVNQSGLETVDYLRSLALHPGSQAARRRPVNEPPRPKDRRLRSGAIPRRSAVHRTQSALTRRFVAGLQTELTSHAVRRWAG